MISSFLGEIVSMYLLTLSFGNPMLRLFQQNGTMTLLTYEQKFKLLLHITYFSQYLNTFLSTFGTQKLSRKHYPHKLFYALYEYHMSLTSTSEFKRKKRFP